MNSPMRRVPNLFSRSFDPKTLPLLVVMLVHLHDLDQLDLARFALDVDRAIRPIEPNRALPTPSAFQWLVMEALVLTDLADATLLDQRNPQSELPSDYLRHPVQLLLDHAAPEDLGHDLVFIILLKAVT